MKKLIKTVIRTFGYDITKHEDQLPSNKQLFANFSSLVNAYQHQLQRIEGVKIPENSLRTTLLSRGLGTRPPEAFTIIKYLEQTRNVQGDVCEFGVAQGETSALIANEIRDGAKRLHLFDSFQGLSTPTKEDTLKDDIFELGTMEAYRGTMAFHKKLVISRLEEIGFPAERYSIHEGFIEKTLDSNNDLPEKVSFAYVDLDLFAPTKIALEFLNPRTEMGAVILVDDHGFFSTGVETAVNEFVQQNQQFKIQIPNPSYGYFAVLIREELT